jgi:hypothetical protein
VLGALKSAVMAFVTPSETLRATTLHEIRTLIGFVESQTKESGIPSGADEWEAVGQLIGALRLELGDQAAFSTILSRVSRDLCMEFGNQAAKSVLLVAASMIPTKGD